MNTIFVGLSKYILTIFAAFYTIQCFLSFSFTNEEDRYPFYVLQTLFLSAFHVSAFACLSIRMGQPNNLMMLCLAEEVFLIGFLLLYKFLYRDSSWLLTSNTCFFLATSFVMLTRLSLSKSLKQFAIAALCTIITMAIPFIVQRFGLFRALTFHYAIFGIAALSAVFIFGAVTRGSRLSFTLAGVTFQPSEIVKISFILCLSGLLARDSFAPPPRGRVLISSLIAAVHVLILVLSRDLGSALIFFIVYFIILYASLRSPLTLFSGAILGGAGAFIGYRLFSHVRNRVIAWRDPFSVIEGQGYQITQSLFAIGTGSWFGMGLMMGSPDKIPIVEADFIFSAISEELGCIFSILLILVILSTILMFMNISLRVNSAYYRLVALGISACYAFQIFLALGGVTKFIPMTGVTLPLISYGGSSVFSTMLMLQIMQGIYLIRSQYS
ncbi:MAG: FtsW/RodA/SpoVE family cell cycle protein [Lachnospiraceae bacterium]|nr:FtsW/RodA/SpoVE family cell cycle protein [Lachnospiraceae bacterium]